MTTRDLTPQEIETYQAKGAVLVKNAISLDWVDRLNGMVDDQLDNPSELGRGSDNGTKKDRMFTDRYLWRENQTINDFVYKSGCAKLAGQAMQSKTSRFYFDHLIVKEPSTKAPTPWHQDVPYWPFLGTQIASVWLSLSETTIEGSSLEFVSGSHLENKYYRPEILVPNKTESDEWIGEGNAEPVPDIEGNRDKFDIIGWDVEPGDALIFSAWTLHGARGNASEEKRRAALSTRWLGDNAIWQPHPGSDPIVTQERVSIEPGEAPHDDDVFPLIWQQND